MERGFFEPGTFTPVPVSGRIVWSPSGRRPVRSALVPRGALTFARFPARAERTGPDSCSVAAARAFRRDFLRGFFPLSWSRSAPRFLFRRAPGASRPRRFHSCFLWIRVRATSPSGAPRWTLSSTSRVSALRVNRKLCARRFAPAERRARSGWFASRRRNPDSEGAGGAAQLHSRVTG